jgi:histidine triad (HIT) family protein
VPPNDACPFCKLAAVGGNDDLVALRTRDLYVVPALKQRRLNRGHMLILPTMHVTRLIDVEPSLLQELLSVAGRVSMAVREAFGATGTTMFLNEAAPDQVLMHLHIHVVPRRTGDEFRMPDPSGQELSREERQGQALAMRRALA